MKRIPSFLLAAVLIAVPLSVAMSTGAETTARAQVVIRFPSPDNIALSQPEYYQGRPTYYYQNNWYYRDGGRWRYYRTEPSYLRDRRAHWDAHSRTHYRYHR